MRVKFESSKFRWLRVRPRPLMDGDKKVRLIETGCEFDVEPEPFDDGEGHLWYHVTNEPTGYVMGEFIQPIDEPEDNALQKMKVTELRKLAKESGITLKAGMTKDEIIKALIDG